MHFVLLSDVRSNYKSVQVLRKNSAVFDSRLGVYPLDGLDIGKVKYWGKVEI